MSNLFNKIIGNLATRIMLIIYLCIIFITSFFILFAYYNALTLQEQRQYDKLTGIVSSMAINIDGDAHELMMDRLLSKTDEEILSDPFYNNISKKMASIVKKNGLTPMYTLVFDEKVNGFVYGIRSGKYVDFYNNYSQSPDVLQESMEVGGVIPKYMSENGTWLSAFHPIRNKKGDVVALLEADINFAEFTALVNKRFLNELLIALGVIVVLAFFLVPYARKVLAEDEIQKKFSREQKLIIESKNRDIMDSIRYALKIQSAILPSKNVFADNGIKGFIYHVPKDVVAGDFYWVERHGDNLFFAVADCTGHGVPGAILSIMCADTLNRLVDDMQMKDTAEILDAAREIIIGYLGQGEDKMQDGMDIALCRLNLKNNELQYAGANNPIYIFKDKSKEISILKSDKQPVAHYIKQKPFTSQTITVCKKDTIFLFTDGYADQFGGDKGKKFKYKNFREFLFSNVEKSMEEQKKELDKNLRNWMKDLEQVDDICVMGVKV